eukprot:IDg17543t1
MNDDYIREYLHPGLVTWFESISSCYPHFSSYSGSPDLDVNRGSCLLLPRYYSRTSVKGMTDYRLTGEAPHMYLPFKRLYGSYITVHIRRS